MMWMHMMSLQTNTRIIMILSLFMGGLHEGKWQIMFVMAVGGQSTWDVDKSNVVMDGMQWMA